MEAEAKAYKRGDVNSRCGTLTIKAKNERDAAVLAKLAKRIIDSKESVRNTIEEIATPTQGATA